MRYAVRPALRERAADGLSRTRASADAGEHDEEALVRRYQETGDEAAFEEIVRRHQQRVFRLALSVLGQGADAEAEDVAQEAFIRVHRGLTGYLGRARLGSWLYRITFNLAVDRRRTARWRNPHVGDEMLDRAGGKDRASDPFDRAVSAERTRVIGDIVERLPDAARTILHLHYWLGSSIDEIAELLRLPPGTVKSSLHRSRRMVHAGLRARGIDDGL